MRVQVRLGGGLATAAGTRRLGVELPPDATVEVLLRRLGELEPAIAAGLDRAVAVVRGSTADGAQPLADGEVVALLIPVAGGAADPIPTERREPWP